MFIQLVVASLAVLGLGMDVEVEVGWWDGGDVMEVDVRRPRRVLAELGCSYTVSSSIQTILIRSLCFQLFRVNV